MKKLIELSNEEAKKHFLKGSSYFNADLPRYISFEPIINDVSTFLGEKKFTEFQSSKPHELSNVNYSLISNKDGKFSWRPFEIMHPVIYSSLVNVICDKNNWNQIVARFKEFETGVVVCCSAPVKSISHDSDAASQVSKWWQEVEQKSLEYSLEYDHLLHTDVTDCYGSIYTHSISWALHGKVEGKKQKTNKKLLGNQIDFHIQSSRYGQTNGISQGSVLMDFIAELVLGYIDSEISKKLQGVRDFKILRYRDDYRIFTNNDKLGERILKIISDELREVGMSLGVAKTKVCKNVIEGSIKADKLAGIELLDLGTTNAKTIQKQLLRLHSFGLKYTNSGALRRLLSEMHTNITTQRNTPDDLLVQIAIATDIGCTSPVAFPAIAGILSYLISLAPKDRKQDLWNEVRKKMIKIPYNGYLEIWQQRIVQPKSIEIPFRSDEAICKIVNGEVSQLWENSWIGSKDLLTALEVSKIVVGSAEEVPEIIKPEEIELFTKNAWAY